MFTSVLLPNVLHLGGALVAEYAYCTMLIYVCVYILCTFKYVKWGLWDRNVGKIFSPFLAGKEDPFTSILVCCNLLVNMVYWHSILCLHFRSVCICDRMNSLYLSSVLIKALFTLMVLTVVLIGFITPYAPRASTVAPVQLQSTLIILKAVCTHEVACVDRYVCTYVCTYVCAYCVEQCFKAARSTSVSCAHCVFCT